MGVFWRQGYHQTSVRDLCEETGLMPGSIYRVFGDKRTLFLAALDRYREAGLSQMTQTLSRPGSPKEALREWLQRFAEGCRGAEGAQGCMLLNAAAELALSDPQVRLRTADTLQRMEGLLLGALLRAQGAGELSPKADAKGLASALLALVEGMRMLGRADPSSAAINRALRSALDLLDGHRA